jgi:polyphosphate glucokinase
MKNLPPHVILGANSNAIEGGIRLWQNPEELKILVNPRQKTGPQNTHKIAAGTRVHKQTMNPATPPALQ